MNLTKAFIGFVSVQIGAFSWAYARPLPQASGDTLQRPALEKPGAEDATREIRENRTRHQDQYINKIRPAPVRSLQNPPKIINQIVSTSERRRLSSNLQQVIERSPELFQPGESEVFELTDSEFQAAVVDARQNPYLGELPPGARAEDLRTYEEDLGLRKEYEEALMMTGGAPLFFDEDGNRIGPGVEIPQRRTGFPALPGEISTRIQDALSGFNLIAVGEFFYDLVVKNQPIANAAKRRISVMPGNQGHWKNMKGWSNPITRNYGWLQRNFAGFKVVTYLYQINYYANGTTPEGGQYIANLEVIPHTVQVAPFWSLNSSMEVGDVMNMGTVAEPIAGVHFNVMWTIKSLLYLRQQTDSYLAKGNGEFIEMSQPRLRFRQVKY